MTTRKTLIVERYGALEVELKKHLDAELFPSLDSVDIADLVYLITISFLGRPISLRGVVCVKRAESFLRERARSERGLFWGRIRVLVMGVWCLTASLGDDAILGRM